MNTTTTPDEYRFPQSTGSVEFTPDTISGEEQVDFHLSELQRLTRETMDHAQSRHNANPNDLDQRRVEFGGAVVGAVAAPAPEETLRKYDPTDLALMARYTMQVSLWRQMEQAPTTVQDEHKRAA